VANTPSLVTPTAAYGFTMGREADSYREENRRSDIARVEESWDLKKVDAGAGYRMVTVID
jgi:hypothetical protein